MRIAITNKRSDVGAKRAFAMVLKKRGYHPVEITKSPADVTAHLGSKPYYFELKCTEQKTRYFGAATLTEWEAALKWPKQYRFVVAVKRGRGWIFEEYSPREFMNFSYVPPFKIFFNLGVDTRDSEPRQENRAIRLSEKRIRRLVKIYAELRKI